MAEHETSIRRRSRRCLNQSLDDCVSSTSATEVIESDKILLSALLRVQWKAYHTSLILDKKREDVNAENCLAITKLIGMKYKEENKINVILTPCSGIRLDDTSPKSVLVEVLFSSKMVYTGYFLNWSTTMMEIGEFEELPILLVHAKSDVTRVVHDALVKVFDFVVTPIFLNVSHLSYLFTHFVSCADNEDEKSATLKYSVPGAPRNSFITTKVRVKDLCVILNYYESVIEDEQELIPLFYAKLLNHFRITYQLDLTKAELREISLPEAKATATGMVQAKSEDVLGAILGVLTMYFGKESPPSPPPSGFISDD